MLNQSDDFLTVDEVCELLKIGHNAAYRMLNTGELKAIRNGRVWRIPKRIYQGAGKTELALP